MHSLKTNVLVIPFMVVLAAGCEENKLEGLQGRWTGSVFCNSGEGEVTMHLTVEGNNLIGTAHTKFKGNNKEWEAKGTAATNCQEDACRSDKDCILGYDTGDAMAGELRECNLNPECEKKCKGKPACDPCQECKPCQICDRCSTNWLPVNLIFFDEHVVVPDPELKLWRFGPEFLKGSMFLFCSDDKLWFPEVELKKD